MKKRFKSLRQSDCMGLLSCYALVSRNKSASDQYNTVSVTLFEFLSLFKKEKFLIQRQQPRICSSLIKITKLLNAIGFNLKIEEVSSYTKTSLIFLSMTPAFFDLNMSFNPSPSPIPLNSLPNTEFELPNIKDFNLEEDLKQKVDFDLNLAKFETLSKSQLINLGLVVLIQQESPKLWELVKNREKS